MQVDREPFRRFSEHCALEDDGTRFGSGPTAARRNRTMTASVPRAAALQASVIPRQRDRRGAIGDLLTAITRALDRRADILLMRGAFEEMLRRIVPARSIRLRGSGTRWGAVCDGTSGIESIALDVPVSEGAAPHVLEATFDPACRLGDWDFQVLGLAVHVGALILEIERERTQLARAGLLPNGRPRSEDALPLIGSAPAMVALRATIARVAATDFTVLLDGESGVGKELVARRIHELSHRRNGPFVAINCAALVETLLEAELFGIEDRTATGVRGRRGKFESADGGTLFLDEVSDLSLSAQAKLLRAIQDLSVERVGAMGLHKVDIRIVAATNRGLAGLVKQRRFRPDLFYRLSGVDVRVPALRERREDVRELAHYFLAQHRATRALRLSVAATAALASYDWPGNVRELERLMERAVALAEHDVIELDDLPPALRGDYAEAIVPSLERGDTMRAWGSRYARLTLDRCEGNKREACRVLGISYHTLQAYLRYAIDDVAQVSTRPTSREAPVGEPELVV
jgi:DNA-binding NtrC family response regulator